MALRPRGDTNGKKTAVCKSALCAFPLRHCDDWQYVKGKKLDALTDFFEKGTKQKLLREPKESMFMRTMLWGGSMTDENCRRA